MCSGLFEQSESVSADIVQDETYDLGQDFGIFAPSASTSAIALTHMSDCDFCKEARYLTWDQLRYLYYHILHQYRYSPQVQFHEFITGGAGTGKTVVLRVIAEAIDRMHSGRLGFDPS